MSGVPVWLRHLGQVTSPLCACSRLRKSEGCVGGPAVSLPVPELSDSSPDAWTNQLWRLRTGKGYSNEPYDAAEP